jgi:hypothetical protein
LADTLQTRQIGYWRVQTGRLCRQQRGACRQADVSTRCFQGIDIGTVAITGSGV